MLFIDHPAPLDNPIQFAALSLNLHPVLPAFVSASGKSILYDCPWCGARHRHRLNRTKFSDGRTVKQTHCSVWLRLFRKRAFAGGDHVRLFLAYDPRLKRAA